MASTDDPVERIVDMAMQAQMRLLLAMMQNMHDQLRRELKAQVRGEFGGEQVHFRKDTAEKIAVRNENILRDKAAGVEPKEIMRRHNVGRANYYLIVNAKKGGKYEYRND